jgi:hypothetical protein
MAVYQGSELGEGKAAVSDAYTGSRPRWCVIILHHYGCGATGNGVLHELVPVPFLTAPNRHEDGSVGDKSGIALYRRDLRISSPPPRLQDGAWDCLDELSQMHVNRPHRWKSANLWSVSWRSNIA